MNIKFAPKKALLITLVSAVALAISTLTASAALFLNPSSVTVSAGQSASASISGGDGSYYASSNTNPSAVQLSINGSGIIFTTTATSGETATITVCDALNSSSCGTIVVTVGTSSSNNNNNTSNNTNTATTTTNPLGPTFGQSSVTMTPNTSQTISIGGNGNYFISNNSSGNVVSASINGSSLVLASNEAGNSTITVCHSGGCNNVLVTVGGSSNSNGISFNQTNPSIAPGGVLNITVSGGTGIYNLSNNSNPVALIATLSGNTVRATGVTIGTSILNVCDSSNSCGSVTVTISGTGIATNTTTNTTTNTNETTNIPQGYAQTLLTQIQAMEAQLAQFSSQLASLRISLQTLVSGNFPTASTIVNTPVTTNNSSYVFFSSLDVGDSGPEVTALQNRLTADGYYSGPVTGYYGSLTEAAVKRFQATNGITAQGNVGPSTRAALNSQ